MRSLSLASVAALALCAAACASGSPDKPGPSVEEGDQGFVARGRMIFISPMGEPFRADGAAPYPVAAWFAGADADHDGRLTQAEFLADADRFFHRLDEDGDGVIDGIEVQRYEREIAPEILPNVGRLRAGEGQDEDLGRHSAGGGRRGGRGGGGGQQRRIQATDRELQGAGLYSFFPDLEPVSSADTSFDGRVTLTEWRAKAIRDFQRLDKTSAGWLTLSTLPKTPQQTVVERRRAAKAQRAGG